MTRTLVTEGIILRFGQRTILSGIDISFTVGRITGLLGRNGEGKTCLMRIIYGDLAESAGSVRFDDRSFARPYLQKELIRYLPQ